VADISKWRHTKCSLYRPRFPVGDVGTATCKRMTADEGHDDWMDLCSMSGPARVSAELGASAGRRGVARNALYERLDDIEYAGKLLGGQLEHAELGCVGDAKDVPAHRLYS
jgi:hypothetical protein